MLIRDSGEFRNFLGENMSTDRDKVKEIPTIVTAKYTGSEKIVASEAAMKRPENAEEVIAKNTRKTIDPDQTRTTECGGCKRGT